MTKEIVKKVQTDADVKRKAVKLVIAHLRKKVEDHQYVGIEHLAEWMESMEEILEKPDFKSAEYYEKRKELNDVIERTPDEESRFKIRDSWFSLGKALDKKVKQK